MLSEKYSEYEKGFNPRAREERDTHHRLVRLQDQCFNPRAREERDTANWRQILTTTKFQSTRSRGARLDFIVNR